MTPKKRILIYRLGSLGDTIIALPCFHLIREKYPDSGIVLLTNKPVASKAAPLEAILGNKTNYFYDKIINYPVGTRNPFLLLSIIIAIRVLRIDTLINITAARSRKSSYRDKIFFRLAGITTQIGFPENEEDYSALINPETGKYEWEAIRLSRRLKDLGEINLDLDSYWDLRLTSEEIDKSRSLLADVQRDSKILVVSTGTKVQTNDWEANNWNELLKRLGSRLTGWTLVVIGAEDEFDRAKQCLAAWPGKGVNLCGKSSPRVSAAVLKQAEIFIGHDSGPMHLASAVNTPVIAIFSSRAKPDQWYPRGKSNHIFYTMTDCAMCGLFVCIEQKKKCILSITVSEVENKVLELAGFNNVMSAQSNYTKTQLPMHNK